MTDLEVIGLVGLSSLFTSWWHWNYHNWKESKDKQTHCHHQWSDLIEVKMTGFHIRKCEKCGKQKHCNRDGSDYDPYKRNP